MYAAPIDRRDSCAAPPALVPRCPCRARVEGRAQSTDIVARRVFFDNPDYGSVRVSPMAQTLAFSRADRWRGNFGWRRWPDPGACPAGDARHRPQSRSYYRWAHTSPSVFFQERDGR